MSSSLLHSQTQGKLRRGKRLIPSSCITSALPAISLCTVILSAAKNPEGHDRPSNSDPFQPESQPSLPLLLPYCAKRLIPLLFLSPQFIFRNFPQQNSMSSLKTT